MPRTDSRGALRNFGSVVRIALCFGLSVISFSAGAQALPSDAEIKALLQRYIERDHWGVGMVVGIVDEHGERVISFGKLDNGRSPEVNGDTLFEIGSITKTFTELLLVDMVERGEMKLDDPVEKYLPASVQVDDPAWGITKRLRLTYRLESKVRTAEAKEGQTLEVPVGAEILQAAYGNLPVRKQTVDVTEKVASLVKSGTATIQVDNTLAVHQIALRVPAWGPRKITLLDLATHSSGLPRDVSAGSMKDMYHFLSQCRLQFKPGTKTVYCNFGLTLLACAIELKAGTNYETLVKQRICQPLGMTSTGIQPTPELSSRWAKSYGQENRRIEDFPVLTDGLGGAGAIRSSANDLLKYAAAELGLTNSPLRPLMDKTQIPRIPHAFGEADLAMPWWIYHWDGAELITHGGTTDGQKAFLGFDKKLKRGVVVLANCRDNYDQAVQPLGFYLLHPPAVYPSVVKLPAKALDSRCGLYEFTDVPLGIMMVRRDGDRLNTTLVGTVSGNWLPQSADKFTDEWGLADLYFYHNLLGQQRVKFVFHGRVVAHARKISDDASDSLMEPMFEPLAQDECRPRPDSDLQGTWEGTLRPWFWPFRAHHGTFRIAEPSPGHFRAELDFPEQKASALPLSVIYQYPRVVLVLRPGEALFKGTINRDHSRMTGSVYAQGHGLHVTIRRADR